MNTVEQNAFVFLMCITTAVVYDYLYEVHRYINKSNLKQK